jgi:multidrug efflux pump
MTSPNLSEWALRHRSLVAYLMVVLMLAGVVAYFRLGRAEDPAFTFKAMVVRTMWPGATAARCSCRSPNGSKNGCRRCRGSTSLRSQTRPASR